MRDRFDPFSCRWWHVLWRDIDSAWLVLLQYVIKAVQMHNHLKCHCDKQIKWGRKKNWFHSSNIFLAHDKNSQHVYINDRICVLFYIPYYTVLMQCIITLWPCLCNICKGKKNHFMWMFRFWFNILWWCNVFHFMSSCCKPLCPSTVDIQFWKMPAVAVIFTLLCQ